MSEILHVWYEDHLAGTLRQAERGDVVFQYSPQWLTYPDTFAVSLSLPLRENAFSRELSTAFFDNYLPEEHLRAMVAKEYGLESHSSYALLRVLGAECAGALSILPSDQENKKCSLQYKELAYENLIEYIKNIPKSPLFGSNDNVHLSLAGAQSKGALRITPELPRLLQTTILPAAPREATGRTSRNSFNPSALSVPTGTAGLPPHRTRGRKKCQAG